MGKEALDKGRLKEYVREFEGLRPTYETFADILKAVLAQAAQSLGIVAIVQARAKDVPSFAEKSIRKQGKYTNPAWQLTDLCGARVITESKDEIDLVSNFIRKHFEIDVANSGDVLDKLRDNEFAYQSVHFIVSLKPGEFKDVLALLARPHRSAFRKNVARLYERRTQEEAQRDGLPAGPKFKAEIQVRTLLQHAWATLSHDRMYKSDFEPPHPLQRDMNRISATLEEADASLVRTLHSLGRYQNYYGAYMTHDELWTEVDTLKSVFKYDPQNIKLAHKIAHVALHLEEWGAIEGLLKPFVTAWMRSDTGKKFAKARGALASAPDADKRKAAELVMEDLRDPQMACVLLDYGRAKWKQRESDGHECVDWAIALNPKNVDAWVARGDICFYGKNNVPEDALPYYEQAFRVFPSDPRVLVRMVQCRADIERNIDFVPLLRPSLEAAIERCRERARVGVYLPDAHYNIGLFAALLERPHESLTAFAKAVRLSPIASRVKTGLEWMLRLQKAVGTQLPEIDSVCRFLQAAHVAQCWQDAADAAKDLEQARVDLDKARKALRKPKGAPRPDKTAIEQAKKNLGEATEAFSEAQKKKSDADKALLTARAQFPTKLVTEGLAPFKGPVVIVAGACAREFETQMREYEPLLSGAFKEFEGTIISGGTAAGISGVVGDLHPHRRDTLRKVAYLPGAVPFGTQSHGEYRVFLTEGVRFSALEPIQSWVDLIAQGVNPASVRLLGINGGPIAAFEYHMALAMGAQVGILRDSGRAAGELAKEEGGGAPVPNLFLMPTDPETVKVFMREIPQCQVIENEDREGLARKAHEEYRQVSRRQQVAIDSAMADWDELHPYYKESSLAQIDHIEEKIRVIGCRVVKKKRGKIAVQKFTAKQIKLLAEIEHGRWNVERLRAGWTLGEKDLKKKKSPYLIAWKDLPEGIKDYDRKTVEAIPSMLAGLGYEIVDAAGRTGAPDM